MVQMEYKNNYYEEYTYLQHLIEKYYGISYMDLTLHLVIV